MNAVTRFERQMTTRHAIAVLALAVGQSLACAAPGLPPNDGAIVTGRWGAPRAGLTLTESGGIIEYDCAHGGFRAPVRPDGSGRFDIAGVHVREHGGPVRMDEVPDSIPARYVGQVSANRMTLRVFVRADTLGPFNLVKDVQPQLVRCL